MNAIIKISSELGVFDFPLRLEALEVEAFLDVDDLKFVAVELAAVHGLERADRALQRLEHTEHAPRLD
jgi:hypothetical protein